MYSLEELPPPYVRKEPNDIDIERDFCDISKKYIVISILMLGILILISYMTYKTRNE